MPFVCIFHDSISKIHAIFAEFMMCILFMCSPHTPTRAHAIPCVMFHRSRCKQLYTHNFSLRLVWYKFIRGGSPMPCYLSLALSLTPSFTENAVRFDLERQPPSLPLHLCVTHALRIPHQAKPLVTECETISHFLFAQTNTKPNDHHTISNYPKVYSHKACELKNKSTNKPPTHHLTSRLNKNG